MIHVVRIFESVCQHDRRPVFPELVHRLHYVLPVANPRIITHVEKGALAAPVLGGAARFSQPVYLTTLSPVMPGISRSDSLVPRRNAK
jgi:hypothetical protein